MLSETEEDLVHAAQAGNTVAFERLVRRVEHQMLALAAGYANSPDDANDIYQDAMVAAYRSLPDFRSESKFSTWLYRIVVNTALSHRRRLRKLMEQLVSLKSCYASEEHYCTHARTPESRLLCDELNEQITRALATLAPGERMAFVLCHQQEFKLREAAEVMSCGVNSVKSYLFRARAKLQKELKPYQQPVDQVGNKRG